MSWTQWAFPGRLELVITVLVPRGTFGSAFLEYFCSLEQEETVMGQCSVQADWKPGQYEPVTFENYVKNYIKQYLVESWLSLED